MHVKSGGDRPSMLPFTEHPDSVNVALVTKCSHNHSMSEEYHIPSGVVSKCLLIQKPARTTSDYILMPIRATEQQDS